MKELHDIISTFFAQESQRHYGSELQGIWQNCVGLPACIHYLVGAVSLSLSCAINTGGAGGGEKSPFLSSPLLLLAQEQKEKNFWEHCCRDQKLFSTGSDLVLSFLLEGKKPLKGTLSKLLGLKIDLPWQCSHLDGLILRSANSLSPYTHQSFHQSGSTGTTQPKGPPSPHNLFWDIQVLYITGKELQYPPNSYFIFANPLLSAIPVKNLGYLP